MATQGYSIPLLPILLLIGIYYSVSCLVGVLAGTAIMHGFLYLIVIIMPLLVYVSLSAMFIVFIKGIEEIYLLNSILTYTVPLLRLWNACQALPLSLPIIFTYIAYIGIAIGFGCFISNKRHLEYTGAAFAFPMLGNLFKSVIVLCFSWIITAVLILGIYNLIFILLIYFIVTLLLSIVTQLQRNKSMDIRFITIQTIVICLFSLFVFITSNSILTHYIPNTIASAWLDIRPVDLNIEGCYDEVEDLHGIAEIQDIHQYLITHTHNDKHNDDAKLIDIQYTLTNGDVIYRRYYVSEQIYQNMIQRIVESDALYTSYISKYYNFLDVLSEVQSLTLYSNNPTTDNYYSELSQDEIWQFQNELDEELRKNKRVDIQPSNNRYTLELVDDKNNLKIVTVTTEGPLLRVIESYFH